VDFEDMREEGDDDGVLLEFDKQELIRVAQTTPHTLDPLASLRSLSPLN
jgi:hypothetical protein